MKNLKISPQRSVVNHCLFVFIFLFLIFSGCKSDKKNDAKLLKKLEMELNNSMNMKFDEQKAIEYIDACRKFADKYKSDTSSASYLFKAGRMAMNLQEPDKANESLIIFDRLINDYPQSKDAPIALFMKAFYLENNLKNFEAAEETYNMFIQKFPHHMLAPDARKSIEYMGKPLEMIIKEFSEKQKDTARVAKK